MKNQTYQKVASHEAHKGQFDKVVLLYSGGLDTSIMLKWIQDEYKAEVLALTIDIGQEVDDLAAIKEKALKLGAYKAVVMDCKEEFAQKYIAPAIKANAAYQGEYHLSTPLGRPLLAKKAVEIAESEGVSVIAHGCTGKGNDQVRIESAVLCENPSMKIIAPVREWSMGRDEQLAYAAEHGIPVKQSNESPYSWDENMWGISGEGGEIEDPTLIPDYKNIVQLVTLPEDAPNKPESVQITFEEGLPVALNDTKMSLDKLIMKLNAIGAKHGVGLSTMIEDRLVGLKIRDVYEAPAAEILVTAHQNIEKLVSTKDANEIKQHLDAKWAYLCYSSKWHEPVMQHLNAFNDSMNEKVSGVVTVKLYKGIATIVAIDSPHSLLDTDLATFNKNGSFNQNASAGFIELYSLAMKTAKGK